MYKRGEKYYERFKYPDGSTKRLCLGTGNKDDAELVKAKLTTDILMDRHFDQKRLTKQRNVRDMITKIYDLNIDNYAEESKITETFKMKLLCKKFGDVMLDSLTPVMLDEWVSEQQQSLKQNTITARVHTFKRYWETARLKYKWTYNDPFKDILLGKVRSDRARYLTDEEREKLLKGFSQSQYLWLRDYVVVACDTGLRRKNMCNMTYKDNVNFKTGTLNFTGLEMKNDKPHTLLMTEHVFNVLSARAKTYGTDGTVFRNSHGEPINPKVLSNNFSGLTKKFGVPDFHLHDMRHDFCCQLALNGAELYDIMDLAGHSNIEQTMRYVHLMPERKKKAIDILNSRSANKLRAVK